MHLVKDDITPTATIGPKTLRLTVLLTVEIPLRLDADRDDVEQDVLSAVRKVSAAQLPYVTKASIAHSMVFEPSPPHRV